MAIYLSESKSAKVKVALPNLDRLKAAKASATIAAMPLGAKQIPAPNAKKKKKKKKGLFGKLKKISSSVVKATYKNPLVKGTLSVVPGVGTAMAVYDGAKSAVDHKKAYAAFHTPEAESSMDKMESDIRAIAAKNGLDGKSDIDQVLTGLANAKKAGKIKTGSAEDQKIAAFATATMAEEQSAVESGEEKAEGEGGGGTGLLVGGGALALLAFL